MKKGLFLLKTIEGKLSPRLFFLRVRIFTHDKMPNLVSTDRKRNFDELARKKIDN